MRAYRQLAIAACLLAAASLAACGGDGETAGSTVPSGEAAESRPAPPRSEFPAPEGRTLEKVLKSTDKPAEQSIVPAAMVFDEGENRYPFGISQSGEEITDAEVALYFARVPEVEPGARSKRGNKGLIPKAQGEALDEKAIGPFPAAIESLQPQPRYRSQRPEEYPEPVSVVYAAEVDFPSDGEWRMAAIIKDEGELGAKLLPIASVGEFTQVPGVGEEAPRIHTPTAAEVDGDLSRVSTRLPPGTQNEVDYADLLGKEPIVLLFATPKFCQSRVCGPVVDVAEQAKEEYEDEAAFIHMEIYNDNDPEQGTRPQVRSFHLPTEPWLYTIDRGGTIRAAVEGAFGPELMDEAVRAAVGR